ncbi:MAG: hypothetical protein JXQ29_12660, partial [Planctomycetes bacterium]|nr:hypothetical protein [Planctomycetota bacterium]
YLIVGGYAVMRYTEPRFTKDLDLWVEATPDNAERVFHALAKFGAPLEGMTPADFAEDRFFYQLGRPPIRVDVLMSVSGPTADPSARRHTIQSWRRRGPPRDRHPRRSAWSGSTTRTVIGSAVVFPSTGVVSISAP